MRELEGTARHPILIQDRVKTYNYKWDGLYKSFHESDMLAKYYTFPIDEYGNIMRVPTDAIKTISGEDLRRVSELSAKLFSKKVDLQLHYCFNNCITKKAPTYVFGKELTSILKKTEFNLCYKHMPKDFSGVLYFPNINEIYGGLNEGILVTSIPTIGRRTYIFCVFSRIENKETNFTINITFEEDEEENLEEIFTRTYSETQAKNYFPLIKLVFQGIAYLSHTSKDLEEAVNVFCKKQSKSESQRKIYTSQNFTMVGFNFQAPRKYNDAITLVEGFYRWQHHGPGNSLLKLIFIEPHLRQYGKEESNK